MKIFQDAGLQGQSVIVTGGSRGIGRAIVASLAAEGADVTFFYQQNAQAANDTVDALKAQGLTVHAYQVDVRDKAQCEASVEEVVQRAGRVDLLVNNSGVVRDNLLVGLSEDDIKTVFDTNLLGVFHMTQACVPFMMRQRAGHIINMTSVGAEKGGRGQANYAASKGGINAMTKALAVELAARNIRVNAVSPGVVETDMSQQVRDLGSDEVLSKILMKRFAQAEEIAHAVVFLASRFATYITGEILHVDGGFKMA